MANYILVHGASHGSWCWERVTALLRGNGHQVVAIDLPGNGHDDISLGDISLETYASHVCQVLDAQAGPAILVGHSLGGLSITQAAEYRPDKIDSLVYLTALLLPSGESLAQVSSSDPREIRRSFGEPFAWRLSDDLGSVVYDADLAVERFYNGCSLEDVAWAMSMLVPQPVGPMIEPVRTTAENFGRVPRVYIECLKDRAIPLEHQRTMHTNLPCRRVLSMNTGHSPFISAPKELATHLDFLSRPNGAK